MHSIDKRLICRNIYNLNLFSLRKIALIVNVSHMTVKRWIQQNDNEIHTTRYDRIRRKTIKSGTPVVEAIKSMIKANPLMLVDDIKHKLYLLFGFEISKSFLSSIMRTKCNFTRKKVKFFGKTENNEELVKDFIIKRSNFIACNKKFISLDETSFSRKGKDVFGFSSKGEKIKIKRPWKWLTTKSCLSCLYQNGKLQYDIIDGSYNKEKFLNALSKFSFVKGNVVIMDNLKIHHSKEVLDFFQSKGIDVLFIPPYSPWYNPIENVFALIKMEFYKCNKIYDSIMKTSTKQDIMEMEKIFSSVLHRVRD